MLDTMVSSAVGPALKAMETAIKTLRGRIEGMIREKIEPIFKAEDEVQEKIKGEKDSDPSRILLLFITGVLLFWWWLLWLMLMLVMIVVLLIWCCCPCFSAGFRFMKKHQACWYCLTYNNDDTV